MWFKFLKHDQKIRMPQGLSQWENVCESCDIFKVKQYQEDTGLVLNSLLFRQQSTANMCR